MVLWAMSRSGPFPATSVMAPLLVTVPTVCLCTLLSRRCQQFENELFPALLCLCPGHKFLAAAGERGGKRICLRPGVDLCKSCRQESGSLLQL